MTTAEQFYPRILRRVQGAFIDGVVIPVAAIGSIFLLASLGVESGHVKGAAAVLAILILEPLAVAVTGGTVGHHLVGMRVRRISSNQNIGFVSALVRFVVKTLTGLPAFLFVLTTKRRQALHDLAARSIIVYKDGQAVPEHEALPELTAAEEHKAYASVGRRLFVILAYWFVTYILWAIGVGVLCAGGTCSEESVVAMLILTGLALVFLVAIAILGWKGYLYGARRQRHVT